MCICVSRERASVYIFRCVPNECATKQTIYAMLVALHNLDARVSDCAHKRWQTKKKKKPYYLLFLLLHLSPTGDGGGGSVGDLILPFASFRRTQKSNRTNPVEKWRDWRERSVEDKISSKRWCRRRRRRWMRRLRWQQAMEKMKRKKNIASDSLSIQQTRNCHFISYICLSVSFSIFFSLSRSL